MGNKTKQCLSARRKSKRRMFKIMHARKKFFKALGLVRRKSESPHNKNNNQETLFCCEENTIFLQEDPLDFVIPEESVPINIKENTVTDPYVQQLHHVKEEEEEEILPHANQDLDLVDLMFLDFSKRFKMFSNNRQLLVKTKLSQVLSDAEFEEIEERQSLNCI
ncbi:uncharacterized protein LOC123007622 [Tribolium madens]|uniref:uncharacterized protein LOC123007622 n=1 Tax=Tribolium madens TaxID=41895 RepID=UPI001CF749A2|nr:uncharacterized protein LOC123007622 [Tribolium madens]